MTQEQTIFDPEGRAVPYADEGHGDGPSLVLIAGTAAEAGALGSIAHILAGQGIRVLRVGPRRGTGDASTPRDEQVADVIAVMDHVDLGDAWVGGYGAGGTVARLVAARRSPHGLLLLGVEDVEISLAPLIPVLIVQGADDDVTPPANGERLRATAPERASVVSIAGAGHLFPVTHPVDTAFAVEDYLAWD